MGVISQVERSSMTRIAGWMNVITKEMGLPFTIDADIELTIRGKKRKFPDIVVFVKYPDEIACLIEYKPPAPFDPYDPELVDTTYSEACDAPGNFNGTVRYFGTWNTNKFVLWDRKSYNAKSYLDMRLKPYDVTQARIIEDITRSSIEEDIRKFIRAFLSDLYNVYFGAKTLPTLPIDEFFVYRLRTAIDSFYIPISEEVRHQARDSRFKKGLRRWFSSQSWFFTDSLDDYDRIARQYTYLIVDKVLFYNALRMPHSGLDEIHIAKKVNPDNFKRKLQRYFNEALDIDYEPIFAGNFIDTPPLPASIIPSLVSFINSLNEKYNFSTIGYDVIGRVFENLIPPKERHILGQYFTRSDVVDLINSYCIQSADSIVLDPGCGAGTFMTRAYTLMKLKDSKKGHLGLLSQLYGIDISKFASHLSMINLSIRDLSELRNYPNIINSDLFNVLPEKAIPRKYKVKRPSGKLEDIKIPLVDAVVGNPPYTRQEEMEEAFESKYKDKLNQVIRHDWGGMKIGSRSGIHAYFFLHGAKFLSKRGRLGFITSNSWLDVDYGKYLQEFFLNHFKIVAIIESKVERWFEDADTDTCITILEKCPSQSERKENVVKFVELKKNLSELIPFNTDEKDRFGAIVDLIRIISSKSLYFENDDLRIYPKLQNELWIESFDPEADIYIGDKWGKYIRAPKIFFKVLQKGSGKLTALRNIAKVLYGIKTGAIEFFFLSERKFKKLGIESQYISTNHIMKSPSESNHVLVKKDDLKNRVLLVHDDKKDLRGTNVLKYIEFGQEKGYHRRPTCASRQSWYDIGLRNKPDILWPALIRKTFKVFLNRDKVYCNDKLYEVYLKGTKNVEVLCALANSTITSLFLEFYGRSYGGGGGPLDLKRYELASIPILDPDVITSNQAVKLRKCFSELCSREIGDIFQELGSSSPNEFKFENIKDDRAKLDRVIFDILDLSEDERKQIYCAVLDLVKSRIGRAKSTPKRTRKKGFNIEEIAQSIILELNDKSLKKFPEGYADLSDCREIEVSDDTNPVIDSDLFNGLHIKIGGQIIKCNSDSEARYIQYSVLNGHTTIKIPKDREIIRIAVSEYSEVYEKMRKRIKGIIDDSVPDNKLKPKLSDFLLGY